MTQDIDLATAQGLVRKVVDAAQDQGVPVAVVVVDRGGHVVAAERMDGVSFLMTEVAQQKATFAGAMGVPTEMISEMAKADALLASAFSGQPNVMALPGGLPLAADDASPMGGLGVAGGHYSQDQAIAEAALGS